MQDAFFLLGAERAGLLLLELALSAHPLLAWDGDFDFPLDFEEPELGEWPPLVPTWQKLARSPRVRARRLRIDPALAFPALVRSLHAQQRERARAPLFGLSVHGHYDRLLRLFPAARFVYVGRSGGRVPASSGASAALRESERAWRTIAAEIHPQRRLELRYEQLVAAPARELGRVCELLGVCFEPRMLTGPAPLQAHAHARRAREASAADERGV